MKTTGVVVLMLLLIVFLILLIPKADKFTPARSTGTSVTSSVTTILIPPSVKLSSLGRVLINARCRLLGQSGRDVLTMSLSACDPLPPSAIQSSCVAVFLFDQLVRAQQDRCRHIEAKRLGGLHIEHGLVFRSNFARNSAAISLAKA